MNRALALVLVLVAAGCGGGAPIGDDADDDGGGADGPSPDIDARADAAVDATIPVVSPDVDGRIVINEVMVDNGITLRDETGNAGDWIELYNPTDQDLSLHGYAITDTLANPLKFHLNGLVIRAGGYLVLWADDNVAAGPFHIGFKLADLGGDLGLARPDGSYIDRIHYGAQERDFSAARSPDGSDRWEIVWNVTPAAANADAGGQPVGLEVASAPPEQIAAAGDKSEHILGYDQLPELAIIVSAQSAAQLEAMPFVYVPAQLVFEGRTYGPVGLRLKGQNSFLPFSVKPSLRINVDEYEADARFWGLKDLTLNNMSGDLSMMHERLGYWVMRQAGVPASRANHLRLTINGQAYGLYANVETVKKKMVSRWFTDDGGALFEGTDVDFQSQYVASFEHETGPDDRTLIAGLSAALTMPSADAAMTAAAGFVDMERFLRYWATCAVIAQFDALPYSYPGDDFYIYADPVTQRLSFIPWGMDETFYSGSVDVTQVQSVLARRCKESPSCWAAYQAQVWSVLTMTEQMNLAQERVRVMAQIAPYVISDSRKPYTMDEVNTSQGALYWFISERRPKLGTMFASSTP